MGGAAVAVGLSPLGRPSRIIAGGQSGADLGALRAALILGIPTGGWMPRGFKTELGPAPWYHVRYGLQEHVSPQYLPRTVANLELSRALVLFGDLRAPGSRQTLEAARARRIPWWVNPTEDMREAIAAVAAGQPLMIGGNRQSKNYGIEAYVCRWVIQAWAATPADLIAADQYAPALPHPIRMSPTRTWREEEDW